MPQNGERLIEAPQPPSAGERIPTPRNAAVDAARLLFAFGVVVIHLAPSESGSGGLLARMFLVFSVQYFFLVSLYFFIQRARWLGEIRWSALHFDRILVPYATWTVLYTLLRFAKCRILHTPFDIEVARVVFYGAGATHLYFVPVLLLWQVFALGTVLLFRDPPRRWLAVALLASAALFASIGKARGYYCFEHAIPIGFVYVALAFVLYLVQHAPQYRRMQFLVGVMLVAAGASAAMMELPHRRMLGPLAAYGVAALALSANVRTRSKAFSYAFSCSFAIYLAHLVFVEVFKLFASRTATPLSLHSALETALVAASICAICIALTALARLHPIPRYLLLGEGSLRRRAG